MKILFLIPSLRAGGSERQLLLLCQGLKELGIENMIVIYEPDIFYDLRDITVEFLPKKGRLDITFPLRLLKLVKRRKVNVIHSFYEGFLRGPTLWARLIKIAKPHVLVISGFRGSYMPLRLKALEVLTGFLTDIFMTNNLAAKRKLSKLPWHRGKVVYLPNIVSFEEFSPLPTEQIKAIRSQIFGSRSDMYIVGMLASYRPIKNHEVVIRAAKYLADRNLLDDILFTFYGDKRSNKRYYHYLVEMVHGFGLNNHFIFNDATQKIAKVINSLDLVVLPSFYEGYPNVVIESLLCHIPVAISVDANQMGQIRDGVNGYVFGTTDHESLGNIILRAKKNETNLDFSSFVYELMRISSTQAVSTAYIEFVNQLLGK